MEPKLGNVNNYSQVDAGKEIQEIIKQLNNRNLKIRNLSKIQKMNAALGDIRYR